MTTTDPTDAREACEQLNASDPARYTKPQPNVPDYCTETSFLVFDLLTGQTVLVPREVWA